MRVRLGTPFHAGVVQQQNAAVPRPRRRCDSVHPLHFRGRSSSAERSFDMREAKRAALFVPTNSNWNLGVMDCWIVVHRPLLHLRPPLQHSTNPAPHFCSARGSRGRDDPPGLEPGSLERASCLAPTIFDAPKALSAMHLLGKQASLVQFRVGAPFPQSKRSRASAQAGFISPPRPGQHWGLRPLFSSPCRFRTKTQTTGKKRHPI